MAHEIDLGNEVDAVIPMLYSVFGEELWETSANICKVLVDKAEKEAYDKIKMILQGEGIKAYEVVYHWFRDVSGLGL
jgi:hypothetical protein